MKNSIRYIPTWFRVMLVASVALVGYGLSNLEEAPVALDSEVQPEVRLTDALWVDKMPEVMHDSWAGYLFTSDNVGLNAHAASAFKLTLEIFEFQARKDTLKWHFPHDGLKAKTKFTIEKLKKPTEHFDHKLTIQADPRNDGKTTVYFTGPELANAETIERLAPGALERVARYNAKL